jgi:L-alanine-DL-glutamate epimerase-like enolase superfamily enzyme
MTPMKITRVHCKKVDLNLTKPYTIAYKTISVVENLFVYLETENGIVGVGAGSPAPYVTGEEIDDSIVALEAAVNQRVLGKDARAYRAILRSLEEPLNAFPAARAAVDIALHDCIARHLGIPLAQMLGQVHQALPTSVTIGIMSVEESLEEASAFMEQGFRVLKVKTGKSVEHDVEVCARIREVVGPAIKIRVDANQGYDPAMYQAFLMQSAPYDIEFVEQPLPRGDASKLLTLDWAYRKKAAADEDLHGPADALQLASGELPYGIYNIKLMKCGGVAEAMRIADIALLRNIDLMWGCNDESAISIAAALHAAFACPNTRYLDLDGSFDLARDLATGGFVVEDGMLRLSGGIGLGVELNM